jgi:hypothetical protein
MSEINARARINLKMPMYTHKIPELAITRLFPLSSTYLLSLVAPVDKPQL